ncbi:MAG: hypothetical protein QXJ23_09480 [Thermofilum sp.]|uniref:hypothetical protein n=1 Tax=Thermofilum sp. TaxID=1961369 RepID=UPI003182018F
MTKTKPIAITILLAVLLSILYMTKTASAQFPWVNLYIYTPEGLKPGAKFTVTVKISTAHDDKFSSVFVRVTAIPIYIETSDDAQLIHYLLLNETVVSAQLHLDALKQYAFNNIIIQPTDTYGYVLPPAFRVPGTHVGNLTLTVPYNVHCGETLFLYINVIVDGESHYALVPIGIVCDAYRYGIFTESQLTDIKEKMQNLWHENMLLSGQLENVTRMLNKCISENRLLSDTLQEKDKTITSYTTQVKDLQSRLEELQKQIDQQRLLSNVLIAMLALTYIVLMIVFVIKRLVSKAKASQ